MYFGKVFTPFKPQKYVSIVLKRNCSKKMIIDFVSFINSNLNTLKGTIEKFYCSRKIVKNANPPTKNN